MIMPTKTTYATLQPADQNPQRFEFQSLLLLILKNVLHGISRIASGMYVFYTRLQEDSKTLFQFP